MKPVFLLQTETAEVASEDLCGLRVCQRKCYQGDRL